MGDVMSEIRYWKNLDKSRPDSAHYSVMSLDEASGMEGLRGMFPDAKADGMNFVLFSTSGVHGTYNTIEEAENALSNPDDDESSNQVTFVIVHPRLVSLRYGVCYPENKDDIEFLKKLRESSYKAVLEIGHD
jgi:hypothetical protein